MRARLTAVLFLLSAACGGSSSKPAAPPVATALAFSFEPGPSSAVAPLSPAIQVELRDASGHLVVGATGAVTLALAPGGGAAVLAGNTTVAAVAGVATFPGLRLALAGSGYRLLATATGLTPATSAAFDVAGGPPTRLQFITQPASGRTSTPFAPPLEVRLLDAEGNRASGEADVTVSLASGTPGGALTGSTTLTSTGGVAGFSDLAIDGAGAYSLLASLAAGGAVVGLTFSLTDAWVPVGPSGGPVAVAADPADPMKALAGGKGGVGLWRTVDGGGHWSRLPAARGKSLRPVFERAGVAWAFGDSLWRSIDGGLGWTEIPGLGLSSDNPVMGLAFDPVTHAATAAVGGYVQQLLTSSDGGSTWTAVTPALPAGTSLYGVAAGPGILFVTSSLGFHALHPGAVDWTPPVTVDGNPFCLVAHPSDPMVAFVGGIGGLHRTGDGGATWTVVAPNIFKDVWIDPAHPATVLAAAISVGLFSSSDGGLTFNPLSTPQAIDPLSLSGSASRLYLGADTGPWVSTDAGATFTEASAGLQVGRFTAVAVSPGPSRVVLSGTQSGLLYRSADGGTSWTTVHYEPGQPTLQLVFDPSRPGRVYLVNGGMLQVSDDDGATWGYPPTAVLANSLGLCAAAPGTLWVSDQSGTGVWRSTDAATTWTRVRTRPSSSSILGEVAADAVDPLVGYVSQIEYTSGGAGTGIYRTVDGGTTWTKLALASYGGELVSGPAAGELWRMGGYDVQRSTDRGATFTSALPPSLNGVPRTLGFDAANGARAALGTEGQYSWLPGDGVQITSDSGATWRAARSGHAQFSTASVVIDPGAPATIYAATGGGGLLRSTSGGF